MLKAVKLAQLEEREVPMQPVSLDIWDKKYRLKTKQGEMIDHNIDDTYQRVAHALADAEVTEEKKAYWYDKFVWALRRGAIPPVASLPTPVRWNTSLRLPPSTAPCPVLSKTPWTAFWKKSTKPA